MIYLQLTEEDYALVIKAMQFYVKKQQEENRLLSNYAKLVKEALGGFKEDYASEKLKEMIK